MQGANDINPLSRSAVTVGTFDGVHRGHREVVDFLLSESSKRDLRPVVITFEPHPLAVVAPERAPKLLELPSEREECLRDMGVEVVVLRFNEELRSLTAAQWLRRLRDEYGADLVVAGFDNTFGCDGMSMSLADYRNIAEPMGLDVVQAPVLEGVSSTLIRRALGKGDVKDAAGMLGHPYSVSGIVTHGRELGRKIGFPTANLLPDPTLLLPAPGVYAADAVLSNGEKHRAVVNIGTAPTVATGLPLTVEAHIIDFTGDLYNTTLRLDFLCRLRDESRFPDLDSLKTHIRLDIENAKKV